MVSDTAAPEVRLVAIDLDGTLLTDAKQVSRRTAAALAELPPRGARVVIASARPPRSVRAVYDALNLDTLQINYNGALIWDEKQRKVQFHRPLAGALVRRIVDEARDLFDEVLVSSEILDKWYTDQEDNPFATETGKLFRPDVVAPIDQFAGLDATKLLLQGAPPLISRLEAWLEERFGRDVSILRTDDHLLQIMDKRVSKATALQRVAKYYGVEMEQVMAIGDAPNDVAMLQVAGVAVAMDNAHALVKRVADWIAPSNNDHGVFAALQRYGLCQ